MTDNQPGPSEDTSRSINEIADRELFASWTKPQLNSTVQSSPPTLDVYGRFQFAYDYFREALFGGELANCILTFTRRRRTLGYFGAEFFASRDGKVAHEISLNPAYFEALGDREALSILVHEQAHLWRHDFGPLNRRGRMGARGYHDKPWAMKMLEIGLRPTDDGTWSGKMTGYRVSHLIVEGGRFDLASRALLEGGYEIRWHDRRAPLTASAVADASNEPEPRPTRSRFTCPGCGQNAWAKHSARLACGVCSRPLVVS